MDRCDIQFVLKDRRDMDIWKRKKSLASSEKNLCLTLRSINYKMHDAWKITSLYVGIILESLMQVYCQILRR